MGNHAWFGHHTHRALELAVSRGVTVLKKNGERLCQKSDEGWTGSGTTEVKLG